MSSRNYPSPKRAIAKRNENLRFTMSTTQSNYAIVNNSDIKRTLVRIVGGLIAVLSSTGTYEEGAIAIYHHRADATIPVMSIANGAEVIPNTADLLWAKYIDAYTQGTVLSFELDVKGMRKMQPGDVIYLSTLTGGASTWRLSGNLTSFLKE